MKQSFFLLPCFLYFFLLGASMDDMPMALRCPEEIWMHIFRYIGSLNKEFLILVNYKKDTYSKAEKEWSTTIHALFCVSKFFSQYLTHYSLELKKKLLQYFVEGNFFEKKIIPYRPLLMILNIWKNLDDNVPSVIKELEQFRAMSDLLVMCRSGDIIPSYGLSEKECIDYRKKQYIFQVKQFCPNYCLPIKITFSDENGDNIWCFLFLSSSISRLNSTIIDQENFQNKRLEKLFLHNGTHKNLFSKIPDLKVLYTCNARLPDTFVINEYFKNLRSLEVVNISNKDAIEIDLRDSNVQDIIIKSVKGKLFLPEKLRFLCIFNNFHLRKIMNPMFFHETNIKKLILNANGKYVLGLTDQETYKTVKIEHVTITEVGCLMSYVLKSLQKAQIKQCNIVTTTP